MLAYWDKNLLCRFANGAYLDWFGKSSDEMIDRIHLPELLGPLYEKNHPYIQRSAFRRKTIIRKRNSNSGCSRC
ncbi:MAG: hypothetical protein IPG90_06755 [Bacteroidetes bacterium]|nr:hypothetical protein [Bacteroidota bacterium]